MEPVSRAKPSQYTNVVFIGDRIENMPVVRRIGDIIRIHKATLKIKENDRKFIVDESSSWCLFNTDPKTTDFKPSKKIDYENEDDPDFEDQFKVISSHNYPYNYSGKNFSITETDEISLKKLRDFSVMFFQNQTLPQKFYSMIDSESKRDTSMICKVIDVKEPEGDTYMMRIKEYKEGYKEHSYGTQAHDYLLYDVEVDTIKYTEFAVNDMIRIKSAEIVEDEKEKTKFVLELKPFTSILKFLSNSYITTQLSKAIEYDPIDKLIRDLEEPEDPITFTEEINEWKNVEPVSILNVLFPEESKLVNPKVKNTLKVHNAHQIEIKQGGSTISKEMQYLLKFMVISYEPKDIREFVKGYCNH